MLKVGSPQEYVHSKKRVYVHRKRLPKIRAQSGGTRCAQSLPDRDPYPTATGWVACGLYVLPGVQGQD